MQVYDARLTPVGSVVSGGPGEASPAARVPRLEGPLAYDRMRRE